MAQSQSSLQWVAFTSNTLKQICIPDHTHSIERVKCEWCGSLHMAHYENPKCSQCGAPMQGEVIYFGSR